MKKLCLFAATLSLICSPAQGQEQTVKTAQEFLILTTDSTVTLSEPPGGGNYRNFSSSITAVTAPRDCETKFDYKYKIDYIYSYGVENNSHERTYYVSWDIPTSIARSGKIVTIEQAVRASPIKLIYPTEALATRVAFAMEFLRTNCDKTKNLAF